MKTVILGANSYIARNLIELNRIRQFSEVCLFGHADAQRDGAIPYQKIDMLSSADMENAIAGGDIIFLLAGKTGTWQGVESPEQFAECNERTLLCLLTAYRSVNCTARIVFPSTRLVYRGGETPLKEEDPKEFLTPYALQKYACEEYLRMYHRLFAIPYCILRIGVPYGTLLPDAASYGTMEAFTRQAREKGRIVLYGDGRQRRTFTYIEDLCTILWQAGMEESLANETCNVVGEDCSIAEAAQKIADKYQVPVENVPWPAQALKIETGSTVFNAEKLEEKIHFTQTMTMDQWIRNV